MLLFSCKMLLQLRDDRVQVSERLGLIVQSEPPRGLRDGSLGSRSPGLGQQHLPIDQPEDRWTIR